MSTFIFGEAMLEYHTRGGEGLRYGGDTLNTAIHLARAGQEVAYVTAVGTDPISDKLVAAWDREGIDTRHVLRHPDRGPGIYAIHLDDEGERSFLYWRDRSAAREMFNLPAMGEALAEARAARLVYFSLISLAIVGRSGRERLLTLARKRRAAGAAVAYDSNFRPRLWPDVASAQYWSRRAMAASTIGLPTNDDERALWSSDESDAGIARRWLDCGAELIVVKAGEHGCIAATSTERELRRFDAAPARVIDSSGAGDAFNAGFLRSWLAGDGLDVSVEAGQSLARNTLAHQGALRI